MPDVNSPPDTGAWIATRSEADTGTAVAETPVAVPETPAATPEAVPAAAPAVEQPAADQPSPAESIVQGLVKAGMTQEQAQELVTKASTPAPVKDALEAFLDGKPYPVPKSLTFKLKSGTAVREATLEQLQREGMLATDYQKKTAEVARARRELAQQTAQWEARDAALKERERWFTEQRDEMLAAQKDPQKWEQFQEVLRMRAANPAFDKLYQDAMSKRLDDASKDVLAKATETQQVTQGVEQAVEWIETLASEFPTVNPERVRVGLSYAWQNGQLPYGPEAVRQMYESEQAYSRSGAADELARLQAENAALKATKDAETHNAQTARVLDRAKAPNTAPAGGGPPAPGRITPPKPIPPDRKAFDEAVSAWSKVRE